MRGQMKTRMSGMDIGSIEKKLADESLKIATKRGYLLALSEY